MVGVPALGSILLDKYRVDNVLGHGGMGAVVQVTDMQLGSVLALKTMLPGLATDPELKARFLREGQAAAHLRSEHVARVVDIGILPNDSPYIVMEYLQGTDLADELRRRILRPREAVDYVLQACVGLAEAHANGIVHRDIKPSNLYVTRRADGSPLIKILDFGISKVPISSYGLDSTRSDVVLGTPAYMSPEQMKGVKGVDARTDIWSLGIVLYECLTGRRPFEADSFSELVLKVSNDPLPPMPSWIPRGLQLIVRQCLEKARDDRFPSVVALANKLARFAGDSHSARLNVARAQILVHQRVAGEQQGSSMKAPVATTIRVAEGTPQPYSRNTRPTMKSGLWLVLVLLLLCSIALIVVGVMLISGWW